MYKIQNPIYVGIWKIGDLQFHVEKAPSWRCRLMMKIFFDWRYEKLEEK